MITWYNKLGFFNNPFDAKPAAFHDDVFGYEKIIKEVNAKVDQDEVVGVFGEYGTGKTTILKGIINNYKGNNNVIYFSKNRNDDDIDFERLIIGAGSFWQKLFRIKKRDMILLADEAQDLSPVEIKEIKELHDDGYFRSIIFVSKEQDIKDRKELMELIGKNYFILGIVDDKEAVKIIRTRIGKIKFISDESIVKVFKYDKNPRAFLKNCEDVCRYAFENDEKKVSPETIKAVLG